MCGLVGVFGHNASALAKPFYQLSLIDQVRGTDSYGVAVVRSTGRVKVFKDTLSPDTILESDAFDKAFDNKCIALLGHNRWATKGAVNMEMAHPFKVDNIVGMHNGTLRGQHHLPEGKHDVSDSRACITSIAKHGIETTWSSLDGAAVLLWWDKQDRSLNVIRNNERSWWFTQLGGKGKQQLIYASEKWMLEAVIERCKLNHSDKFYQPNKNFHFKWTLDKDGELVTETQELEEYVPKYNYRSSVYGDWWDAEWASSDWQPINKRPIEKRCSFCGEWTLPIHQHIIDDDPEYLACDLCYGFAVSYNIKPQGVA